MTDSSVNRPGLQPVYVLSRNYFRTSIVLIILVDTALKQPEVPRHGRKSLPHRPWVETWGTSTVDGIEKQGYVLFPRHPDRVPTVVTRCRSPPTRFPGLLQGGDKRSTKGETTE